MLKPIIFLTHTDADRARDYPEPALAALRELADIRLNRSPDPLHGDALIQAASGAQIIVADRQTPGPAGLFAAGPQLVAFVCAAADSRTVDVPAASATGVLVTRTADANPAMETTRQVAEILRGIAPEGAVNPEAALRLRRFAQPLAPEVGGTEGPEPTRYGDWQHKGRVTDF